MKQKIKITKGNYVIIIRFMGFIKNEISNSV